MGTECDQEVVGNVDPQKRVLCLAQAGKVESLAFPLELCWWEWGHSFFLHCLAGMDQLLSKSFLSCEDASF